MARSLKVAAGYAITGSGIKPNDPDSSKEPCGPARFQKYEIREFCLRNDLRLLHIHEDPYEHIDKAIDERPYGKLAMRQLYDRRADNLVVYSLDRVCRNRAEILALLEMARAKEINLGICNISSSMIAHDSDHLRWMISTIKAMDLFDAQVRRDSFDLWLQKDWGRDGYEPDGKRVPGCFDQDMGKTVYKKQMRFVTDIKHTVQLLMFYVMREEMALTIPAIKETIEKLKLSRNTQKSARRGNSLNKSPIKTNWTLNHITTMIEHFRGNRQLLLDRLKTEGIDTDDIILSTKEMV